MKIKKGYILVLRTNNPDNTSYGGFKWVKKGYINAPDWKATKSCGNGLHGALKGCGDGSLFNWDKDALWLVCLVKESDIIDLNGKVKFPECEVIYCGTKEKATTMIYKQYGDSKIIGFSITSCYYGQATAGDYGQATAGYNGQATAGNYGQATAGDNGQATAGDNGQATAGDYGQATAGYNGQATAGDYGQATAGDYGQATAGYNGQATAGDYGILIIKYWDSLNKRYRTQTGYIGENGLKPNVKYKLNDEHNFVEA